ncbi:hypothetical protein DAETH_27090 [Deinococcus aetherius]|uniref:DUF7925 domain-containing protein n=1 Tax=Deinococcus aetherius TaxID=200252 RepID=A0ABM8AG17_9DEIO|nr:hypothetical protein [Deinococcus aetherius]BDP42740.1 hypothetical protein DAETH_27090 [Deinococcus aetherius]
MKRLPLTLACLLASPGAWAQSPPISTTQPRVQFTLTQDLVRRVQQGGQDVEQIVPNVKTVVPGDLLREQISVKNVGGETLRRVFVGSPVPRGTEFVGEVTANTSRWRVEYSIDDGRTYNAAPRRTVTVSENGQTVTREVIAPVSTYTHVRWTVGELGPGKTLKFAFRVRVK